MNVFQTHSQIIKDYSSYVSNFINISDPAIREKVDYELENRKLWPEPLLQFNPAFEMAGKVSDLANTGVIHPAIADIFKGYSLYQHQVKAIELGTKGKDFIVTSGTGSGKSLTYIGSIFHYLLSNPGAKGGTAVVVYPMNALINSQFEEFNKYKEKYEKSTGEIFPITFGQYTGQEKEKTRENMRENPPHVLLTNYMMLELLLTRTRETRIRDAIYSELKFLVFDELHTYRGRQGADVAMLIRRIRSQAKNEITCIGTSATMVSAGTPEAQRKQVAMVATTLFGKQFEPDQIINEKLTRSLETDGSIPSKEFLAESMSKPVPDELEVEFLKKHPVAIWIENRIALEEKEGNLLRRRPLDFRSIVSLLSLDSGIEEPRCRTFLEEMLQWISKINKKLQDANVRYTYLPFKLHQFISQTGSVYTTLDQDENRFITLEPG
ncbi:MAG: DEAD/DEAH box helicase, partial [Fibrobacteres bacterium]|nr:DEAD/DEAH box helicase [Fibrobacterota bacterium]